MHDGIELGVKGAVGHVDADDAVGGAVVEQTGGQPLDAGGR